MHPGHQHPQYLQGHTMFPRPTHGPGFRPGGPLGHFGFGGNAALGHGAAAGMDFSMFIDNGHGHNVGLERPKKVHNSHDCIMLTCTYIIVEYGISSSNCSSQSY